MSSGLRRVHVFSVVFNLKTVFDVFYCRIKAMERNLEMKKFHNGRVKEENAKVRTAKLKGKKTKDSESKRGCIYLHEIT